MWEFICIVAGIICLLWGFSIASTPLVIIGIVLLALGGVLVLIFDGDFDWFD